MLSAAQIETATVEETMARNIRVVSASSPLKEAARLMRDTRVSALAVADSPSGGPAILTERDLVCAQANHDDLIARTVADHVTAVVVAGEPSWTLARAAATMLVGGFRHLVIVEDEQIIGMLSMQDIMRAIAPREDQDFDQQVTQDFEAIRKEAADQLYSLRRTAKQHKAATHCTCELDWLEVIVAQVEARPQLGQDEINSLWQQREPCPILSAEGGGAD